MTERSVNETLNIIKNPGIIAISRGLYGDELVRATLALYEGGIRAFEAAFVQSDLIEVSEECIRLLVSCLPDDAAVGAGTMMDAYQLASAYEAGARFAVSPNTDGEVIREAKRLGMASIPGAMTPTEIAAAYAYGADIVKVFPAGDLGAGYFKAVRAPLAHIPMAAVGGLTKANIKDYQKAGAIAYGISGSLYNIPLIKAGEYEKLTEAAREYVSLLK